MSVKPILFSGPMVRGLLREVEAPGTGKTETRRVLKPQPTQGLDGWDWGWPVPGKRVTPGTNILWRDDARPSLYPYLPYAPGDLLWVRESWAARLDEDHVKASDLTRKEAFFWADGPGRCCNTGCAGAAGRVRAAFHLPRRLSRLTLKVTDVRVHQLLDITEEEARSEGFAEGKLDDGFGPREIGGGYTIESMGTLCSAAGMFQVYWAKLHPEWDGYSSPWVCAISFTVHRYNVDLMQEAA
jgi:hypothetical protein